MQLVFLPCHIFLKEPFALQEIQALIQGGHCEAAGGDPRHDLPDLLVPGELLVLPLVFKVTAFSLALFLLHFFLLHFFLLQDGIEELEDPTTVSLLKSAIHTPEVIIRSGSQDLEEEKK